MHGHPRAVHIDREGLARGDRDHLRLDRSPFERQDQRSLHVRDDAPRARLERQRDLAWALDRRPRAPRLERRRPASDRPRLRPACRRRARPLRLRWPRRSLQSSRWWPCRLRTGSRVRPASSATIATAAARPTPAIVNPRRRRGAKRARSARRSCSIRAKSFASTASQSTRLAASAPRSVRASASSLSRPSLMCPPLRPRPWRSAPRDLRATARRRASPRSRVARRRASFAP